MITQAVVFEHGSASKIRIRLVDAKPPGEGEVSMLQSAIGINQADAMLREGKFGFPLPTVLGFEGAGVVTQVGPNSDPFQVGDRVAYHFSVGAYASERTISTKHLVLLPEDITFLQAATFLAKGLTSWMALRMLHDTRPGDTVLVMGASGSVGSILTRWAKAMGAIVIGVAGSDRRLKVVQKGAHHAFSANDSDLLCKVLQVAPNGVDLAIDFVGKATFDIAAELTRLNGKILTLGSISGAPTSSSALTAAKNIAVIGGGTPNYVNQYNVTCVASSLFQAIRNGTFQDLQPASYCIAKAAQAHADLENRCVNGIPVLIP